MQGIGTGFRELDGVGRVVEQGLLKTHGVTHQRRRQGLAFDTQLDTPSPDALRQDRDDIGRQMLCRSVDLVEALGLELRPPLRLRRCAMPRMAFIGVQISWLMLARKFHGGGQASVSEGKVTDGGQFVEFFNRTDTGSDNRDTCRSRLHNAP